MKVRRAQWKVLSCNHQPDRITGDHIKTKTFTKIMKQTAITPKKQKQQLMQPSARQDNRRSYQDEDLYEDYETDSYYSEETETATDENSVDSEDPVGLENVPLTSQGVD